MVSIDMKKIVCIQILLWMSCLINVSAQDSYKEYEQKGVCVFQGVLRILFVASGSGEAG